MISSFTFNSAVSSERCEPHTGATGSEEVWNNYWYGFCQQMAERPLYRQPCLEWWDARGCGCSPATNSTRVAAAFLLPVRTHEDRE